jgi:hypothetical protein
VKWKKCVYIASIVFGPLSVLSCDVITVLFTSPKEGVTTSGEVFGTSYCVFGSTGSMNSTYTLDGNPVVPVGRPTLPGDPAPCLLTGRSVDDSFEKAPEPGPHTLSVSVTDASGKTGKGTVHFTMVTPSQ